MHGVDSLRMMLRQLHEEIEMMEEEVTADRQGQQRQKRIAAAKAREELLLAKLVEFELKVKE
jgi:hypothetical protein